MFVRLIDTNGEEVKTNISQIVFTRENEISLSNGVCIFLSEESTKELDNILFGDIIEANPKASEYVSGLLNELHKLCGGKGEAKPTTDRKARLKARLKDFSDDEMKTAAYNLGQDEFMQGANDNNKRYGTIDYLLRTSSNVNQWLEEQPKKKKGMF